MRPLSYKKGEILVNRDNDSFGEPYYAIYEGLGSRCEYPPPGIEMDSVTRITKWGIKRHDDTWPHFWRVAKEEQVDDMKSLLESLGYYMDEKTHEIKMCPIQDLEVLKKRLKKIVTDAYIGKDEREILINAIDAL
ncbi:MAG: hypothetical protein J6I84_04430 [Bacilli bacterium]|nr:hypothetical protein [Bacilli bacterium]